MQGDINRDMLAGYMQFGNSLYHSIANQLHDHAVSRSSPFLLWALRTVTTVYYSMPQTLYIPSIPQSSYFHAGPVTSACDPSLLSLELTTGQRRPVCGEASWNYKGYISLAKVEPQDVAGNA